MAGEKRFYWLKLRRDFFKRHDIRIIEEMPNGKDYLLFYLKMLLESIDHEGALRFSETIPYNEQMLSVITNTNIDIVRSAMKVFTELNMIEIFDDSTIYMQEVEKLIGSETASAARVRKHRQNIKALQCNTDETKSNTEKEKDIDKDIDINNICSAVISYLNEKAGTNYRASSAATRRHISGRINEGYTLEDFYTVIDKKCAEWKGGEMQKYLRPDTLFGTKFDTYLNAPAVKQKKPAEKFEVKGGVNL